jgi:small subunit ribosomal protein S5
MVANNNENPNNDSEYKEVLVSVKRVAKVVKGGRRFGFSVVVVAGNGKGLVGYGLGKAKEVMEARTKASQAAKKSMMRVYLKENRTVHHDVLGHSGAGRVLLRSAPAGTGIIAGGAMRAVFEMVGLHDVVAKSLGSSNVHNMIGATFDALEKLSSPKQIADRRNKKVGQLYNNRKLHSSTQEASDEVN